MLRPAGFWMSLPPVVGWLLEDGPRIGSIAHLLPALGARLGEQGVPLMRVWYGTMKLHPQLFAKSWVWRAGEAEALERTLPHAQRARATVGSPVGKLSPDRPVWRQRLDGSEPPDVTVLAELKAEGGTDFVVMALGTGQTLHGAFTITTDHWAGFSDADVALLTEMRPALSVVTRVYELTDLTHTLLGTYLGHDAAERVLSGQVHRGDGDTIPAVLWFSDLRDFTGLSDRLPREALLEMLNDVFEAQVAAVEEHGGQVLKFMGDGMLAIFPASDDPGSRREACSAALGAARSCEARLRAVNDRRTAAGATAIRWGLALHLGEVMYGNIGSTGRLDFTVIGPAVNRAARLESLCARLGRSVLASAEFAAHAPESMVPVGEHTVKGFADPLEAYAPAGL